MTFVLIGKCLQKQRRNLGSRYILHSTASPWENSCSRSQVTWSSQVQPTDSDRTVSHGFPHTSPVNQWNLHIRAWRNSRKLRFKGLLFLRYLRYLCRVNIVCCKVILPARIHNVNPGAKKSQSSGAHCILWYKLHHYLHRYAGYSQCYCNWVFMKKMHNKYIGTAFLKAYQS